MSEHLVHTPIVVAESAMRERRGFRDHRFEKKNLDDLVRIARRYSTSSAEFLPVFAALTRDTIGSFRKFDEVHEKFHCKGGRASNSAIKIMRDLLLETVDQRLQRIYREHLRDRPPRAGAPHDSKIATLETTRGAVSSALSSYGWQWLADWLNLSQIGETAGTCLQRLANFAFQLDRVNFRFTYHCNIACRHCYNSSGPRRKQQRLKLEAMLAIVAEMPDAGIGRLNLTGGEPFLYPHDLDALIAAGRAAGLDGISIYTNGFWASTDRDAKKVLGRLAQAGFMQGRRDHIKVSAGAYHQEFIPFERILILARNYYGEFGRPLRVDFEMAPQTDHVADDLRDRIESAGMSEQVRLTFRHVVALGRGRDIDGTSIRVRNPPPCRFIDQIVFDPDGSARPCCGLNNENQGIVIGRSDRHRLKDLAKRMQNDPILQFLSTQPMSGVFAKVSKLKKEGYSGLCDLCQDAIGDLVDKEPLQAALFDQQSFYPFWFRLGNGGRKTEFVSDELIEGLD